MSRQGSVDQSTWLSEMNTMKAQWRAEQVYLVWVAVVVEWRNPSGSARVVPVSGNGYHPSFQSDIVDFFWMDSSLIFGPTVQPHAVAPELKGLDATPEEDLQKIHARHPSRTSCTTRSINIFTSAFSSGISFRVEGLFTRSMVNGGSPLDCPGVDWTWQ